MSIVFGIDQLSCLVMDKILNLTFWGRAIALPREKSVRFDTGFEIFLPVRPTKNFVAGGKSGGGVYLPFGNCMVHFSMFLVL